ncbi:MAG: hypothetical protein KF861_01425 [Planctomycetaceae bacterium]|nr:hypothetical protein [Planctomycetaceae bacterium]
MERLNGSMNGESPAASLLTKSEKPGAIEKIRKVEYLVPAESVGSPLAGRDIMETVQRSQNALQVIVNDIKDILRNVEADVQAMEAIQLTEEPNKRTLTISQKIRIRKDR